MKFTIIFLLLTLLVSCECEKCNQKQQVPKTKEQIKQERLQKYDVEFLFEVEGVRVYSFNTDRDHYFTTNGEAITTDSYRSGKVTNYRDSNIKNE